MKFRTSQVRWTSILVAALIATSCALGTCDAQTGGRSNNTSRQGLGARLGSALKGEQAQNRQTPPQSENGSAPRAGLPGRGIGGAPNAPQTRAGGQEPTPEIQSVLLKSSQTKGSTNMVEVTLEASGEVLQTTQVGKTERAAMEVVAGFKYEERFDQYSPTGATRSFRRYEQAGMRRKFGSTVSRPLLDSSRKFIVSLYDGKKVSMYSVGGPMKYDQYALLSELPFNTTILDRLLPNRVVKLGEEWTLDNATVAALLGVDAIENNTIHFTLTSVVDNFAEVEMYQVGQKDANGVEAPSTLVCASEGASVALDLEGKFQFDLTAKRITWFGVRIKERRSESVATPGLDWSATLKINLAPMEKPDKLDDEGLEVFKDSSKPELLKLYYNAQNGPWKFQHSRKWKMIEDSDKITALCYLDQGEAVAQCNILSNGKIDLATKPTIEGYKDEIKKGLDIRFAEFKQEAAYDGPDESTVYYVVADGAYEDIPFRWIYYLITDKEGNQATIMFELRADMLDKYDDSGNDIVESFRLVPRGTMGLRESLEQQNAKDAEKPKE